MDVLYSKESYGSFKSQVYPLSLPLPLPMLNVLIMVSFGRMFGHWGKKTAKSDHFPNTLLHLNWYVCMEIGTESQYFTLNM
jgi:hypothetical protein